MSLGLFGILILAMLLAVLVAAVVGIVLALRFATRKNDSTAQATGHQAPAGWLRDPSGRHELRYWDGSQWTAHVSSQGNQSTDAL